ncbi:MAG TPA: DUF1289 domain-containing protein [Thauera sp.]|jgi:hypothetical protein|uniref:DUF1289 domain-containing protein n=1 Tax=Thauera sp. TaxID=1905334 RepID=UPI000F9A4EFA|nr:DUF1289 domain-containing protein [Thauera sp.]RTL18355.1 MAG: DUF1289 domain-containing protein [Rhodocyclaceae bacterium]MCB1944996.1 DUF1289 domain-containing protein [Thauera sp.]MCP5226502.1 DUF1289 domain-containing protein [Thauera sp.]HPE04965.1 DUF1289 domain-containing protein [Thauera sp.]HRV76456.1 DUF1289 domain-containing protein [Thauera sp.]
MSGDALCVGVCMIDWDAGVCLGCGRSADEINGMPASAPDTSAVAQPDPAAVSAARQAGVPLPPNVAARVGEGSD